MRHLVIPDTQVRPGVCINHLNALGNYIVDKQPDKIIMLGDWADMHSLSSYDVGKKAGEGARYEDDIAAAKKAMELLLQPLQKYNDRRRRSKHSLYTPNLHLCLGNHEQRIARHVNNYPVLDGRLGYGDLDYEKFGWTTHGFLETIELDGILYSHYFPRNATGHIVQTTRGAPNARTQVIREGQSCTSGHLQGLDFHIQQRRNGRHYGLIAGSFYMHEEDYLSPQGTEYWRGVIMKNEVHDGNYDIMTLSLNYLLKRYWDGTDYYA